MVAFSNARGTVICKNVLLFLNHLSAEAKLELTGELRVRETAVFIWKENGSNQSARALCKYFLLSVHEQDVGFNHFPNYYMGQNGNDQILDCIIYIHSI